MYDNNKSRSHFSFISNFPVFTSFYDMETDTNTNQATCNNFELHDTSSLFIIVFYDMHSS